VREEIMKNLILGLLFTTVINVVSLKAQPLYQRANPDKINAITIGGHKYKKGHQLKKEDYITENEDRNEDEKMQAKTKRKYNKLHKKEERKTEKIARRYQRKPRINEIKSKEEVGL
jgi:hypothetical protein